MTGGGGAKMAGSRPGVTGGVRVGLALAALLAAAAAAHPCSAAPTTLSGYLRDGWQVRFWLEHENAFIIQKGNAIMRCNFHAVNDQPAWLCRDLSSDKVQMK